MRSYALVAELVNRSALKLFKFKKENPRLSLQNAAIATAKKLPIVVPSKPFL